MKYLLTTLSMLLFLLFPLVQQVHAQSSNHNLTLIINSVDVSINDPECGFNPRICILKTDGEAYTIPLGKVKYSTTLTSFWTRAFPNGKDGFCAPTEGEVVITNKFGKINAHIQGNTCDITFQSEKLPHLFEGQYNITSGTGKYVNASGTGEIKGWETGLRSIFSVRGNISY